MMVDHRGRVVDGDAIMFVCARHMKRHGELRGNTVVATVMSNVGLEVALRREGIDLVRTAVGDRFVGEALMAHGYALGGEQSGHVIFPDFLFTGDGMVTALCVLRVMADTGQELADLAADYVRFPQVLVNVRVARKVPIEEVPALTEVMAQVEQRLGGTGRLLVRYSGTEPLLRIMIEGPEEVTIRRWAEEIATLAGQHLG